MTPLARLVLLLALAVTLFPGAAYAGIRLDLDAELLRLERGEPPERHIAGARTRVAVFTYEDPDATGLGNALAALVAHEVLLRAQVGSIGVLRYEGRLSGTEAVPLSYFDKVDKVTAAQEVTLSLWGVVRRSGDKLFIDTYAQLPAKTLQETFSWQLVLPEALGQRVLIAHLRPDRIHLQRLAVPAHAIEILRAAAARLDELRAAPRDAAAITGALPTDATYWIAQRDGDWIRFEYGAGRGGWTRYAGHCTGECAPLLEAARFAGDLLRFAVNREIPSVSASLTTDAAVVRDELAALELLDKDPAEARWLMSRWLDQGNMTPGGAALANVHALGEVAVALVEQELPPERLRYIAFKLAAASQTDPNNTDVLLNLAVLFELAGDGERARLAGQLAAQAGAVSPDR